MRPPRLAKIIANFFGLVDVPVAFYHMGLHAVGRLTEEEKTFIPEMERSKVFLIARIWIAIYAATAVACVAMGSILPAMYIGLPRLYGAWHHVLTGLTQHAGLAEDTLDHRLNSRTVHMNPISRFVYWNMNYHVEHHMFPMVPYHALPALHQEMKGDCPRAYSGLWEAYREIVPAVLRQLKDPTHFVRRQLPAGAAPQAIWPTPRRPNHQEPGGIVMNWIEACIADDFEEEDVVRFDHGGRTFAIYRSPDDEYFATDGYCTHEQAHLADGLVMDNIIECPKHNGRFDYRTGEAKGAPVCVDLKTYPVKVDNGKVLIDVDA
jgi:MocE subfamily Rieske [2Fe-2S] domain protein